MPDLSAASDAKAILLYHEPGARIGIPEKDNN
jgi:hypothetical protein